MEGKDIGEVIFLLTERFVKEQMDIMREQFPSLTPEELKEAERNIWPVAIYRVADIVMKYSLQFPDKAADNSGK